jgi:hypothetical protein
VYQISKTDNEKLVIELYESGMSTKQIQLSNRVLNRSGKPVTLRWIQQVLREYRGNSIGRSSHAPLFSLEDIKIIMKNPDVFEELTRDRFKTYYIMRGLNNNGLRALRIANKVLERDKYKCTECGSYYDLECHHKTHKYDNTEKEIDNCVTLCRTCHLKVQV